MGNLQKLKTPLVGGPYYEAGYIEGGNGGDITITAPSVALDGNLQGDTVAGPRQEAIAPLSSSLSISFLGQILSGGVLTNYSPAPPAVIFTNDVTLAPASAFAVDSSGNPLPLAANRQEEVVLSPDLVNSDGFENLSVDDADGKITVPADVTLSGAAGGSILLQGANIDIEGGIIAPGGNLNFTAYDVDPTPMNPLTSTPAPDPTRGNFTLGQAASLNTAGLIVDNRLGSPTASTLPLVTNGGSVTITSYSADLAAGSTINVSGGFLLSPTGSQGYGKGGSITIKAGQDPSLASLMQGTLVLDATLEGYAGDNGGGALTIQSQLIQVGGAAAYPETLLLMPAFFNQGGFASFTLEGLGGTDLHGGSLPGVLIAPGTVLDPVAESSQYVPAGNTVLLVPMVLQAGVRAPVNLSLVAPGVSDPFSGNILLRGEVTVGQGAVIQTDPLGSVSLTANGVTVEGSIIAPGGKITISGGDTASLVNVPTVSLVTVDLGPQSLLSTAGTTLLTPDPTGMGYRTGSVLNGGSVTVSGNIAAEAGAVINVSGATDVLDLPPADSGLNIQFTGLPKPILYIPTRLDSNAGEITLAGKEELFSDATLIGAAGGPSASGGNLSITSGIFSAQSGVPFTPLQVNLVVTQAGPVIPAPFYPVGGTPIGSAVVDTHGNVIPGLGYVAVNDFAEGGFASLSLAGTVDFSGPVTVKAGQSLTVGTGGVIFGDAQINLVAPYVALGMAFQAPLPVQDQASPFSAGSNTFQFDPAFGTGVLNVTASLIDIGNLSLQNIGAANFTANNGDIRGDGTLDVAGVITLTAGQVYPPTEVAFTIAAYDYQSGGNTLPGTVTVLGSGNRQLPLSAGGELNIYASVIDQGGVLRAPIGVINLGWDGQGTAPGDPITGLAVDATQQLTLAAGSQTLVSAVDPLTGRALIIPYGINLNGTQWIDPSGMDITAGGVSGKQINLSAANIADQAGAKIDINGGGDLYAYRFVSGLGGTSDILASASSFAVLPGYQADYAPYAPNNTSPASDGNLGGDAGYANSGVAPGDQVYLRAGGGLAAGVYTLLPARYALLPGAYLVTPEGGNAVPATVANPDGSGIVAGYRIYNGQGGQPQFSSFEVDSQSVVQARAEYDNFYANSFLQLGAVSNGVAVPKLPVDAGQLVLEATQSMVIEGRVNSQSPGGLGGQVDISSPEDIVIASPGVAGGVGTLVLDANELSSFNAQSLLIGGVRQTGTAGTTIKVTTNNITVDNAGAPLTGPDVILAANDNITLDPGAGIEASGASSNAAQTLLLGNASSAGSGDGVLLRVSSDPAAQIVRSGVATQGVQEALATPPSIEIGVGAVVSGHKVTIDSTYATSLDANAIVSGNAIALDSGQISLQLANPGSLQPTVGLVLTVGALQSLQGAQSLSLLSYSSIDIYGTGQVGAPTFADLALHAGEIRGFNNGGGGVAFVAQNILLDNGAGGTGPGAIAGPAGTLAFNAGTIELGVNQFNIDQYATVQLDATGGILAQGTGGLALQGGLNIAAPLVTGAGNSNETIVAGGALVIQPVAGGDAKVGGGLGATLILQGANVTDDSDIVAPSGEITLHATSGDVVVGDIAPSSLDAGGTGKIFFDLAEYTSGGGITLTSDAGNVTLGPGSTVTVVAQAGGGSGGIFTVNAPLGLFTPGGKILGQGGAGGENGTFLLDAGSIPGGSLAPLEVLLNAGGFTSSQTLRVRNGNVVVDSVAQANTFNLSADSGSITVGGTINASGLTGGTINLQAAGSVVLEPGALLTVAAQNFNDAGQGGTVTLEAGSETNGNFSNLLLGTGPQLDLEAGSTIDLSVAANTGASAAMGEFTGMLHLRAPQALGNTDLQVQPINGTILNASSIIVEGYQVFDASADGSIDNQESNIFANGQTFAGPAGTTTATYTAMFNRLFASTPNASAIEAVTNIEPGAEVINPAGDLTLSNDWDLSIYRFGPDSAPGVLTIRASGNLIFQGALSDGFDPSQSPDGSLWLSPLLAPNALLPVNAQDWSYNLAAGADFSGAGYGDVQPLSSLGAGTGSLELGQNDGLNLAFPSGPNGTTSSAVEGG